MGFQNIKLVTFDATNTLLRFRVPPWQHYAVVAREHGFKGTSDEVKNRLLDSYKVMWDKYPNFGKSTINWEDWWRRVVKMTFQGQLPVKADIDCIATRLINEFKTSKCWYAADGGEKILTLLKKRDIYLGVISNFDPRLNEILQNVNLLDTFEFIITSYEIGYSKPDERIFKLAQQSCGEKVESSECLHIGDDVRKDYEGARAAGWHALLIGEKIKSKIPPVSSHVFKNLDELNTAIEQDTLKL